MKTPTQELVELIEEGSNTPRSYSGRGMYGRTCLGFVTDDIIASVVDIMASVSEENKDDIAEILRTGRTDNLGRSEIVYFPRCEWENPEDDDNEE